VSDVPSLLGLIPANPQLIVSKKNVPAANLKEFIAWLKANEPKAAAGTAGAGSASHIAEIYFQKITGTRFTMVPYRGTGPAMNDLVAGQIDLILDRASNSMAQVRAGTIKAYAVTAKTRLPSLPEIPTVDEAGAPGLHISVWYGLWVPKGIVARLNDAAPKLEPRLTKLRLVAQSPRGPLRRRPNGDEHDGDNDGDLTPENLGGGHRIAFERMNPTRRIVPPIRNSIPIYRTSYGRAC
jgi:hypothetical protein